MVKTLRKGIGKAIAAVTVIAMFVIVVGVGGFFASQGPPVTLSVQTTTSTGQSSSSASSAIQSTCTGGATVTETIGSSAPPCGCVLVDSTSNGSLYISPDPSVGNNVCVEADLVGSSQVYLSITNSTGSVVFSYACFSSSRATTGTSIVSSSATTTGGSSASGISCLDFWNTANPNARGVAVAGGAYRLTASDSSSPSSPVILEANFVLY